MESRPITLALGGGGARGLAHLGVIEVLQDAGFTVERVVGISMGSLVGAVFAFEPDILTAQKNALDYILSASFQRHQQMLFGHPATPEDESTGGVFSWYLRAKEYLRANRLFHRVIRSPSLLPGVILTDVVNHMLPEADIADAEIPLSIVAVDLRSGHQVVLETGPVRDAVRASSSLPAIFPPVEIGEMCLCDLGVTASLPTAIARAYNPRFLVAVDVGSELKPLHRCETVLDIVVRMEEVGERLYRRHLLEQADLVIQPKVAYNEWYDFSLPHELIAAGRHAAYRMLPELKRLYASE